jgi:hypothetical protein
MTALVLLPDVEVLLSEFLRNQPEVTALVTDHVYTEIPKAPAGEDTRWPLVRLSRYGGTPVTSIPLWLDQALVQVDVFGGSKRLANRIAETCRAVLDLRLIGVHAAGVVTGVRTSGFGYHPDATYTPAKPRYLFTATVTLHPLSS